MKKIILLSSIVLLGTISQAQKIIEKEDIKFGGYGKKKLKKVPKKIYIKGFFINHQVVAGQTSHAVDGSNSTAMTVAIDALSPSEYQEIVDKTYNRFVEKLKAENYEIISADEALKTDVLSGWQKLSGGTPSRSQFNGFISTAPTGYDFLVKKVNKKGKAKNTFLDNSLKISKQMDDIIVFNGAFNFQFVELDANSNYLTNSSSVKAKVKFEMASTAYAVTPGILGGKTERLATSVNIYSNVGPTQYDFLIKKNKELEGVVKKKKFK